VGCRVSTAYRGVVERARLVAGEVLAVHGCGGVGLAAVALGRSAGAHVVAIDISREALAMAAEAGASVLIDASAVGDVAEAVFDLAGGAHVSVECLGSAITAGNSIRCLRPLGRHVQIGLFPSATAELAISRVIRDEVEVLGVHGLSASRVGRVLDLVRAGSLDPTTMIRQRLRLDDIPVALPAMGAFTAPGVAVAVLG